MRRAVTARCCASCSSKQERTSGRRCAPAATSHRDITMTPETSAPADGTYSATKTAKQRLLERYENNHAKTLSVLKAFPGARSEFRPHDRSSTALQLAWTFVLEERMILKA